ncbi:MAG: OmpA family protein [Gemmatimonadota bacterium]
MTRRNVVLAMSILAATSSLVACRKKPEPEPAPAAAVPAVDNNAANRRRADSISTANAAAQRRADSLAAARTAAANAAAEADRVRAELTNTLSQRVYFDYDQDVLRDDARAVLDAKAAVLAANGGVTIVITGHTDERGTAEYNLALGQRRAAQVKRYLESKGISESRMSTQSLGDSQPASQGTDEAAYQLNRRAEFESKNTSGTLVRPRP